jgi:hypothetical protein
MEGMLAMASILGWILLIAFLVLMVVGIVTLMQDLWVRGPYQPPSIADDDEDSQRRR